MTNFISTLQNSLNRDRNNGTRAGRYVGVIQSSFFLRFNAFAKRSLYGAMINDNFTAQNRMFTAQNRMFTAQNRMFTAQNRMFTARGTFVTSYKSVSYKAKKNPYIILYYPIRDKI